MAVPAVPAQENTQNVSLHDGTTGEMSEESSLPPSDDERDLNAETPDTERSQENISSNPEVLKREAQRAAFNKYLLEQREHETEEASPLKALNDPQTVVANSEGTRIIDRVRDYQQELFERAKEENVIAVLDTGSGKTLIACLLIRHVLEQERLQRAENQCQKIVCFLANSVHLVQQQARVLANNLIEKPAVLYGNAGANLWCKTTWDRIKTENRIVVCTPAVLDQALAHSYLAMADISLLVFDEAHHTKKDHPYSRLIRSYYLKCPAESRPKIFGMTASAVDTKGDITRTAQALEQLLHAKIVTTSDLSLLSFAPRPTDVKWTYGRLRQHFDTDLYSELFTKVAFCQDLRRGFEFSKRAIKELGPWCADRAWLFVMGASPQQSSSICRKFEQGQAYAAISTVEERKAKLQALSEAVLLVQRHAFDLPKLASTHLSTKVLMLYEQLVAQFTKNPDTRAIVFVEERLKALVLNDCFKQLNVPNLRTGTLLGIAGTALEHISIKQQEEVLLHFRAGLINLVFATSVADEGLDIPQCNLCVRFDLCKTTIQYMQSRGRARMKGSIFAHMIEEGELEQTSELEYQIANEDYIKKWCASLAPDRKLGHGTQLAKLLAKDEGGKGFKTTSGAVCDNSNSLVILARFAASLRYTGATDREIYEEEIDIEKNLFRYTVRLPANDECCVSGCRGEWKTNKQLAKRSAAWACCYLLRKKKQLDGNLHSIYRKVKPENANAHLAVTSKKSAYDMQIKPSIWKKQVGTVPEKLFATMLRFEPERMLKHPLASLVVLTRSPLPALPSFSAYLEAKTKTEIIPELVTSELDVTGEELHLLTRFTLEGVFSDVFNKGYDYEPTMMSYWLAPMARTRNFNGSKLRDIVDVPALQPLPNERISWQPGMSTKIWEHKFLTDPLNGKFRYFTGEIVKDVKITDPVPAEVPHIAQKKRGNIIDFSNSTWTASKKRAQAADHYDLDQPVLAADLIGPRRNFLDSAASQELIPCLVAPQYLHIARIDADVAASCMVWPAIIHRIESYMIALEAFEKLGLKGVPADLALEAFTKDADNEDEEIQTHTGGKRGMGKNYERLEFIGDSFLKMTTTLAVFVRTLCDEEGMHCRRMELLCNRTLFNVATSDELQLYRHARTLSFDRNTWYPEHLKLRHGRGAKKDPVPVVHPPRSQDLGMKTIADMSEAIIGATIVASQHLPADNNRFDLAIQAVTKLVHSPDHAVSSWSELVSQYKPPNWSFQRMDPVANDRARLVESKTGYRFKYPCLLRSAFTHSSDMNSPVPDLQRLEFLGDAVLDYVCISWLFNANPTRDPQWLTEHKMAMVTNKFLAALAVTLDFDKFILVTTAKLIGDIQIYADKVREAMAQPECPKSFWTEIESPPKALSDLVESYLGAVLVDSGFDYSEMEKFFERHVKHFFENISDYDTFANRHPTTYVYHKLGQEYQCRNYTILDSDGTTKEGAIEVEIKSAILVHGTVISLAKGTSARYARVRASRQALAKFEGLTRDEFRRHFGCDCTIKDK